MGNQVWIRVRPMLIPHNPKVNILRLLIVTLKLRSILFFLMMYLFAGGKTSENKKV